MSARGFIRVQYNLLWQYGFNRKYILLLQALLNDDLPLPVPDEDDRAIIIPTATFDPTVQRSRTASHTQSSLYSANTQGNRRVGSHYGVPSLVGDELAAALEELHMSSPGNDLQMLADLQISAGTGKSGTKFPRMFTQTQPKSMVACQSNFLANAINTKTGANIFSLDVSPRVTQKPLMPKAKRKSSSSLTKVANVSIPNSSNSKCSTASSLVQDRSSAKSSSSGRSDDWLLREVNNPPVNISQMPPREKLEFDSSDTDTENFSHSHDFEDAELGASYESPEIYAEIAVQTKSVGRFNKLAYPDMYGHIPPPYKEPLHEKQFGVQR